MRFLLYSLHSHVRELLFWEGRRSKYYVRGGRQGSGRTEQLMAP